LSDIRIGLVQFPQRPLNPLSIKAWILPCVGSSTHFGLNKPIYEHTAAYGHFGRPPEDYGVFSCDPTDFVAVLTKNC